ncbi:NXPE family member 4-like [Glandiceps talaboti]
MKSFSQNKLNFQTKCIFFVIVFFAGVLLENMRITKMAFPQIKKTSVVGFKDILTRPNESHATEKSESVFQADLFPYMNYSHFGMEWKSIIEEYEWSYGNLERNLTETIKTFETGNGSFGLLSISKSKLFLVPEQSVVRKGDYVHVVMESYDEYDNRRLRGGDFLQAVMLQKSTAGRVLDFGNGTYSIYFYAGWKGDAVIRVSLISYRESILFLNYLRSFDNMHIVWTATFSDGEKTELRNCTIINEGIWEDKCYYVNSLSLGKTAFICEKPEKLSCETLSSASHNLNAMETSTAKDMERVSYLFSGKNQGEQIQVKIDNAQEHVSPELPSCEHDLPIALSSGYWKDNLTFVPLMCRSQQWLKEDMEKCLLGKHLYFYGDSTLLQIIHNLNSLDLRNANITFQFVFLRAGSPSQSVENMLFEGDYIDRIQYCSVTTPVLILNSCFHFAAWATRAYLDRLFGAKYAVLRLLKRCPKAIVVIKLAHPRDNVDAVQSVHSANYIYHDMNRMIRRVFGGIGVRFLDIWDLVLSHPAKNEVHMPPHVIMQELYLMLSYICPDMVEKS